MSGRKPLPTAVKKLRGTDQPVRINKNEPQTEIISKMPPAPDWFSDIAKKIYKTKSKELIAQNVMGKLDIDMFLLYCNEYATYVETSEAIKKVDYEDSLTEASDLIFKRLLKQNQRAWERAKSIAIEFGFTPSSRARVKTIGKAAELSEFEKMFR